MLRNVVFSIPTGFAIISGGGGGGGRENCSLCLNCACAVVWRLDGFSSRYCKMA